MEVISNKQEQETRYGMKAFSSREPKQNTRNIICTICTRCNSLIFRFWVYKAQFLNFLNFLPTKNVEKQEKSLKINSHIQDDDMTIQ